MIILIKIKTQAKQENIKKLDKNNFIVSLKELPIRGRANESLINLLAKYFKISKFQIEIIKGLRSKNKIVKINK